MSKVRDEKYLSEISKDFKLKDGDAIEAEVLPLINIVKDLKKETRIYTGQCTGVTISLFTVPTDGCYLKGVFINNINNGGTGLISGSVNFTDYYGNIQSIYLSDYGSIDGSSVVQVNTNSSIYIPLQKVRLKGGTDVTVSNSGSNYTNALIEVELI